MSNKFNKVCNVKNQVKNKTKKNNKNITNEIKNFNNWLISDGYSIIETKNHEDIASLVNLLKDMEVLVNMVKICTETTEEKSNS